MPTLNWRCVECDTNLPEDAEQLDTSNDELLCRNCADDRHLYRWSRVQHVYVPRSECIFTEDGEIMSESYAEDNSYFSDDGLRFAHEERRDDYERQSQESDDYDGDSTDIYGYHDTNPIEQFGWPDVTKRNELCFGVELEMEGSSRGALTSALGGKEGNGTYLLMMDGSLNDTGVELITSPFTLEYHQTKFDWTKVLGPAILQAGAKSGKGTTNCGMHVHMNRRAISALTLGKMLVLVNHDKSRALMQRIAQRDGADWARMYPKKISDGRKVTSNKYEALHVCRETIECRIFRGNLRTERILKNIEFCHALVLFCKQASVSAVEDYNNFLAWLGKNRKTYPNLVQFLTEASYISDPFKNTTKDI